MTTMTNATPPSHMICPLTLEIMKDPVSTRYGHSYERQALLNWLFQSEGLCPLTRQPLNIRSIITNHKLKAEIKDWMSRSHTSEEEEEEGSSSCCCAVEEEETEEEAAEKKTQLMQGVFGLTQEETTAPRRIAPSSLPRSSHSSSISSSSSSSSSNGINLNPQELNDLLSGKVALASSSYRNARFDSSVAGRQQQQQRRRRNATSRPSTNTSRHRTSRHFFLRNPFCSQEPTTRTDTRQMAFAA